MQIVPKGDSKVKRKVKGADGAKGQKKYMTKITQCEREK